MGVAQVTESSSMVFPNNFQRRAHLVSIVVPKLSNPGPVKNGRLIYFERKVDSVGITFRFDGNLIFRVFNPVEYQILLP